MKPLSLVISFALLIILSANAQVQNISYVGSGTIMYDDLELDEPAQIFTVINKKGTPSYELLHAHKKYKSNRGISKFFSFFTSLAGGIIFGQYLTDEEINGPVAGVGVGSLLFTLIFNGASNNGLRRVVTLYNTQKPGNAYLMPLLKQENGITKVGINIGFK